MRHHSPRLWEQRSAAQAARSVCDSASTVSMPMLCAAAALSKQQHLRGTLQP